MKEEPQFGSGSGCSSGRYNRDRLPHFKALSIAIGRGHLHRSGQVQRVTAVHTEVSSRALTLTASGRCTPDGIELTLMASQKLP